MTRIKLPDLSTADLSNEIITAFANHIEHVCYVVQDKLGCEVLAIEQYQTDNQTDMSRKTAVRFRWIDNSEKKIFITIRNDGNKITIRTDIPTIFNEAFRAEG